MMAKKTMDILVTGGAGYKRFIFASTCSNYGKIADPTGYVDEKSPLAPISLYAELKVKTEKYILENKQLTNGFSPTILMCPIIYAILSTKNRRCYLNICPLKRRRAKLLNIVYSKHKVVINGKSD